jgi:sulfur carrier protein
MKITVAGQQKEYDEGLTVEQLIAAENVEMPLYVTVTVNDDFVATADRETRTLKEGDSVEFLYFMGGGC